MTNETFELFFSLLTVATCVAAMAVVVLRLCSNSSPQAASVLAAFAPFARPLAASIATTCALGSLYFSEIVNYTPCRLCWFQRTMMYPLAIILVVSLIVRDARVWRYAVPLSSVGIVISTYHWFLERFPNLDAGVCDVEVPCEFVWFEHFGFVTLPFMALTGFIAVIVFTTIPKTSTQKEES
jgi:disulfide bond formation protein DsbB